MKLVSFTLPPSPLPKEWKTKEWNIGMFETPPSIVQMEHCPDTLDEVEEDDEDKSIHLEGIEVE